MYNDACHGIPGAYLTDNVQRSLTLYGDYYGEFTLASAVYLFSDPTCGAGSLDGVTTVYGTFALRGPSDCGGLCPVRQK